MLCAPFCFERTMSDRFCLSYKYDPNKHTVDYCVGSTERSSGFRYIDNAQDEESALLQNIAVFMKSFHVFLGTYTRREMRNDYMRTLEEMAKNFLRDHIAEERYRSITKAM